MRPEQEEFVAPVAWLLAEAYASPEIARPRLVRDGEAVVGFVMGGFDPQSPADREVMGNQVVGEIGLG